MLNKSLLATLIFSIIGITSFAQEKTESVEKEPKITKHSKKSNKTFPSEQARKQNQTTQEANTTTRTESGSLPNVQRQVADPKEIERRRKAKEAAQEKKNNTEKKYK